MHRLKDYHCSHIFQAIQKAVIKINIRLTIYSILENFFFNIAFQDIKTETCDA